MHAPALTKTCGPCLRLATPPNVCCEVISHSYAPRPIKLTTVLYNWRWRSSKRECHYLLGLAPFSTVTVYLIFKSYCCNLRIPYFILQSQTIRASIPEEAIPASSKPSSAKGLPPKDVIEHVCPEFSLSSLRVAKNEKKVCVLVCTQCVVQCSVVCVYACVRACVRAYIRMCVRV